METFCLTYILQMSGTILIYLNRLTDFYLLLMIFQIKTLVNQAISLLILNAWTQAIFCLIKVFCNSMHCIVFFPSFITCNQKWWSTDLYKLAIYHLKPFKIINLPIKRF